MQSSGFGWQTDLQVARAFSNVSLAEISSTLLTLTVESRAEKGQGINRPIYRVKQAKKDDKGVIEDNNSRK